MAVLLAATGQRRWARTMQGVSDDLPAEGDDFDGDDANDPFAALFQMLGGAGGLGGLGGLGALGGLFGGQTSGGGWVLARQIAGAIAAGDGAENNVDPADRIAYEQLSRVAELNVTQLTGLSVSDSGRMNVRPATRHEWATAALDAYRPFLEGLGTSLSSGLTDEMDDSANPQGPMAGMGDMLGSMMLSMTAGSTAGQLAQRNMGDYDLPLPRPDATELLAIHANVVAFTEEWSVPVDDVRLWVCLNQLAHHAVLRLPHVNERLTRLFSEYAAAFRPDQRAIQDRFGDLDISDPSSMASMQSAMADPEAILGVVQTDEQRAMLPELTAIVAAVEGYCDWVMDTIGTKLIGSYSMLSEALRRRRITAAPSDRFIERMLGLELDRSCYDRGANFVAGVIERGGADALGRLWVSARELPTPNELDAPGLWLARIDIPDPELGVGDDSDVAGDESGPDADEAPDGDDTVSD